MCDEKDIGRWLKIIDSLMTDTNVWFIRSAVSGYETEIDPKDLKDILSHCRKMLNAEVESQKIEEIRTNTEKICKILENK